MDGLTRWVPRLLVVAAVAHAVVAVGIQSTWADLARDGLWNTLDVEDKRRQADFWYAAMAPTLFGLAAMGRSYARSTGTLPAALGITLLVTGVPMSVLIPVSGGWALGVLGVLALVAARRTDTRAPDPSTSRGRPDPITSARGEPRT